MFSESSTLDTCGPIKKHRWLLNPKRVKLQCAEYVCLSVRARGCVREQWARETIGQHKGILPAQPQNSECCLT